MMTMMTIMMMMVMMMNGDDDDDDDDGDGDTNGITSPSDGHPQDHGLIIHQQSFTILIDSLRFLHTMSKHWA